MAVWLLMVITHESSEVGVGGKRGWTARSSVTSGRGKLSENKLSEAALVRQLI